jgi:hypothetical protein
MCSTQLFSPTPPPLKKKLNDRETHTYTRQKVTFGKRGSKAPLTDSYVKV